MQYQAQAGDGRSVNRGLIACRESFSIESGPAVGSTLFPNHLRPGIGGFPQMEREADHLMSRFRMRGAYTPFLSRFMARCLNMQWESYMYLRGVRPQI